MYIGQNYVFIVILFIENDATWSYCGNDEAVISHTNNPHTNIASNIVEKIKKEYCRYSCEMMEWHYVESWELLQFQWICLITEYAWAILGLEDSELLQDYVITVKPALAVTSVKRSPAHNGQFLALPTFFTI